MDGVNFNNNTFKLFFRSACLTKVYAFDAHAAAAAVARALFVSDRK